jgi:oxygen-independent coproporphyrinogen-3 oxidase
MSLFKLPPLSLYVHIPWCIQKCPYCDFNSWGMRDELDEQAYVNALLADLEGELAFVHGRELQSIFIGGGTPSLFSGSAIGRLLEGVRQYILFTENMEVTLEANPGASEAARFAAYRRAGVNRLSIGVQSLHGESLQRLGRIHGPQEAVAAVEAARAAGFDNINLDLMFGLPGQALEQAMADLQAVMDLEPEHISYYQLTLEPGTPFYRSPPPLPEDDLLWEIFRQGQQLLAEQGYRQYEVSAYAQSGRECRHNLNYWTFGDYIGIGAGAHGKMSDPHGRVERRSKIADPRAYLESGGGGAALVDSNRLEETDLAFEFMMNALRLCHGFTPRLFEMRTGLPFDWIKGQLDEAEASGLLEVSSQGVCPTLRGHAMLNDLVSVFLP